MLPISTVLQTKQNHSIHKYTYVLSKGFYLISSLLILTLLCPSLLCHMDNQQVVTVVGSAGDEDDSVSLLFVLQKAGYSALFSIDTQHGEQAVSLSLLNF